MLVHELIELLLKMPGDAMLVFEDAGEEEFSYEGVEVTYNFEEEAVTIRTV